MTQTLYPHEWILKHIRDNLTGIIITIQFLVIVVGVGLCVRSEHYLSLALSLLPLAIVITAFMLALHYMTRGQYYGMNKI